MPLIDSNDRLRRDPRVDQSALPWAGSRKPKTPAVGSLGDRFNQWRQRQPALKPGELLTSTYIDAYAAVYDVLGREPTSLAELSMIQGLITTGSEHAYSDMALILSLKPEARRRGVDPTQFGNSIVDPASVPDELKPFYDEWKIHHKDEPFYTGHLWQLDWQQEFGSVGVQQGLNDGTIKRGPNGEYIVTQEAVDKYGADQLWFGGAKPNDVIMVPRDSGIYVPDTSGEGAGLELYNADDMTPEELANAQAYYQHFTDEGYDIRRTTGPKMREGVFDYADQAMYAAGIHDENARNFWIAVNSGGLGAGNLWEESYGIKEGQFIHDPSNVNTGWMWGEQGVRDNLEGAASIGNKDPNSTSDMQDVQSYQGMSGSITSAVASYIPVVGWAVAAGIGIGRTYSQAQLGRMDWDTAAVNASLSVLAAYLGANTGGDAGSLLSSGQNMAAQSAIAGAQAWNASAARGDGFDTGSILTAALVSYASSFAAASINGFGFSHGFTDWQQAALQGASGFGLGYLGNWYSQKQNPGEDSSSSDLFSGALVAGANSAYAGFAAASAAQSRIDFQEAHPLLPEVRTPTWGGIVWNAVSLASPAPAPIAPPEMPSSDWAVHDVPERTGFGSAASWVNSFFAAEAGAEAIEPIGADQFAAAFDDRMWATSAASEWDRAAAGSGKNRWLLPAAGAEWR